MFVTGVILYYLATVIFRTSLHLESDLVTHFLWVCSELCLSLFLYPNLLATWS